MDNATLEVLYIISKHPNKTPKQIHAMRTMNLSRDVYHILSILNQLGLVDNVKYNLSNQGKLYLNDQSKEVNP